MKATRTHLQRGAMRTRPTVAASLMAVLACALLATTAGAQAVPPAAPGSGKTQGITFTDVTRELGVTWKHTNGARSEERRVGKECRL